jgi:hypothetical protein
MRFNKMVIPKNILFSGTASKSINILDPEQEKISQMFNEIYNEVYKKEDAKIEIKIDNDPKIITAKGALKANTDNKIEELIQSYIGLSPEKEILSGLTYSKIDFTIIDQVIENLTEYFNLLDGMNTKLNFNKSFGISNASYETFKNMRMENCKDYLLREIEDRKIDVSDVNGNLEETLFFYPLKGLLNELATKVSDL